MTLKEFIEIKCNDILEKRDVLASDKFKEENMFSYDAIEKDDYGNDIKVIYDDIGNVIKLDDIFELSLDDFMCVYKFKSSIDAYRKYMSAYKIIKGKELWTILQKQVKESIERLKNYDASLNTVDLKEEMGLIW